MDQTPPTTTAELTQLQQRADEYLAGWQRAKADYLNLKKQSERERDELVRFANAALLVELLPIYDNLKRAMAHVPDDSRGVEWVQGFTHIHQQFRQLLEQLGVREIATVGQPFDPERHHAVSKEHRPGTTPGTILAEVKTGFTLHDKVIEPAMVTVADGLETEAAPAQPAAATSAPNLGQEGDD